MGKGLRDKKLALFLDRFGTLAVFDDHGILVREAALYNMLSGYMQEIIIFTYGNSSELRYKEYFQDNIKIIPRPNYVPQWLYEIILPFLHYPILRSAHIFKSNQNIGSLAPTIAKLLNPKAKLIIRSGYIGSETAQRLNLPWFARAYFSFTQYFSYRLCTKAFIASATNAQVLLEKYQFLKNRIVTINNYVDTELFKKTPREKKYDIIYVARLEDGKNHMGLLEAIKGLPLKILLIGRGKKEREILEAAEKMGVDLTLIDVVLHKELPRYYDESLICVFPSLHEGNPKALLEAMSMEMPVVGLDVPGVRDIITHGKNGILVNATPYDITYAVLGLLDNAETRKKIARNARSFIIENYSLPKLCSLERAHYKELFS